MIEADTAVPLGIVMTELVTNAVKYAFPAPRSGRIKAQARRRLPDRIEIVIHDNGVGLANLREGSLGYGLVRSLVGEINGEIDKRSDAGLAGHDLLPGPAEVGHCGQTHVGPSLTGHQRQIGQ